MVICIESYLGNRYLSGKFRTKTELKQQIQIVESLHDREMDNFVPLLCRMYGWAETEGEFVPDMTYDRDTGLILPLK